MSNEILGKGLKSLIPDDFENTAKGERVFNISPERIVISDHQPRKTLIDKTINELATSIKEHGIIQPLIVAKTDDENYQLIAGQRRLQAARKIGLNEVPVIVKEVSLSKEMEMSLIENVQREDLNPIEEAKAYKLLIDIGGLDVKSLSNKLGKAESTIINSLRLLNLSEEVQQALIDGVITSGHARTLITLPVKDQIRLLSEITKLGLSVRETEVRSRLSSAKSLKNNLDQSKDPYLEELEDKLRGALGTKVIIAPKGKGGKINIDYYSKEELEKITNQIIRTIESIEVL